MRLTRVPVALSPAKECCYSATSGLFGKSSKSQQVFLAGSTWHHQKTRCQQLEVIQFTFWNFKTQLWSVICLTLYARLSDWRSHLPPSFHLISFYPFAFFVLLLTIIPEKFSHFDIKQPAKPRTKYQHQSLHLQDYWSLSLLWQFSWLISHFRHVAALYLPQDCTLPSLFLIKKIKSSCNRLVSLVSIIIIMLYRKKTFFKNRKQFHINWYEYKILLQQK